MIEGRKKTDKTLHDDYHNIDKLFKDQLIKTKVSPEYLNRKHPEHGRRGLYLVRSANLPTTILRSTARHSTSK